jgi:hypothetical protein
MVVHGPPLPCAAVRTTLASVTVFAALAVPTPQAWAYEATYRVVSVIHSSSTSLTGEPDNDQRAIKSVPKSTFRKKTVVIRYAGATNQTGIAYRWSTTFALKRIKFAP